ncbi:MAG TPA: hypothetical protein VIH57_05705 [Bacteroidales bacterium]
MSRFAVVFPIDYHLWISLITGLVSLYQKSIWKQTMSQNHENSIIVTISSICGGVSKTITSHLLLANITFPGIIEVAFYAAISALVGYGVKKGIDSTVIYFKKRKK